jgi:hypothetical protein
MARARIASLMSNCRDRLGAKGNWRRLIESADDHRYCRFLASDVDGQFTVAITLRANCRVSIFNDRPVARRDLRSTSEIDNRPIKEMPSHQHVRTIAGPVKFKSLWLDVDPLERREVEYFAVRSRKKCTGRKRQPTNDPYRYPAKTSKVKYRSHHRDRFQIISAAEFL